MLELGKVALFVTSLISFLSISPNIQETVATQDTYIKNPTIVTTETKFSSNEITEREEIPFETEIKTDDSLEFGITKVLDEGKNGFVTRTFLASFYDNEEIQRELIKEEKTPPSPKIILNGAKIAWKTENAQRCGDVKYWHKYENVYMTTYTNQCEGCNAWTSLGLRAGYGIIAVDPKKIPYWTKVCIPRYGIAIAGDTGGAMRTYPGLLIDLGFDSMSPEDKWLSTGRYDMYILNNEDKADKFYIPE